MIEVGMAQHHGIDFRGIERKRVPVARLVFPASLDHAAVQQYLFTACVQDVAGAGDLGGGTKEF